VKWNDRKINRIEMNQMLQDLWASLTLFIRSLTNNIMINVATASKLDLLIADTQGSIKYTVLPTRKARKSELLMSRTNGPRTNTNRRGQAYSGHATHAQNAVIQGNDAAYFKTSGWGVRSVSPSEAYEQLEGGTNSWEKEQRLSCTYDSLSSYVACGLCRRGARWPPVSKTAHYPNL
jgi:hypothetical protein